MLGRIYCRYLAICSDIIERATRLDPTCSAYRSEKAHQRLLIGDVESASQIYSESSQLDESNLDALYGMIRCKIFKRKFEDAAQELEFLSEIGTSEKKASPQLLLMQALLTLQTER